MNKYLITILLLDGISIFIMIYTAFTSSYMLKEKNKSIEDNIKSLVKLGKYEEIFSRYGRNAYLKFVPNRIKNKEYKKLKKEGRYEDIYSKLGSNKYEQALNNAMFNEIKQEQGIGKAIFWKIKENIRKELTLFGIYSSAVLLGLPIYSSLPWAGKPAS